MSQTDRLAHSSFCLNAESVSKNAPCGAELTLIYWFNLLKIYFPHHERKRDLRCLLSLAKKNPFLSCFSCSIKTE